MTSSNTKNFFRSAAVFNWLAVVTLAPWFGVPALLGLQAAGNGIYDHIALLVIAGFGFAYWMVGTAPERHRGIIVLGGTLKLSVVAVIFCHVIFGSSPWTMAALVSGDLIYAGLFFQYLKRTAIPA